MERSGLFRRRPRPQLHGGGGPAVAHRRADSAAGPDRRPRRRGPARGDRGAPRARPPDAPSLPRASSTRSFAAMSASTRRRLSSRDGGGQPRDALCVDKAGADGVATVAANNHRYSGLLSHYVERVALEGLSLWPWPPATRASRRTAAASRGWARTRSRSASRRHRSRVVPNRGARTATSRSSCAPRSSRRTAPARSAASRALRGAGGRPGDVPGWSPAPVWSASRRRRRRTTRTRGRPSSARTRSA